MMSFHTTCVGENEEDVLTMAPGTSLGPWSSPFPSYAQLEGVWPTTILRILFSLSANFTDSTVGYWLLKLTWFHPPWDILEIFPKLTLISIGFAGGQAKTAIADAIEEFKNHTCVNFRQRHLLDRDYVLFYSGDGWATLHALVHPPVVYSSHHTLPSPPLPSPPLLRCFSNIGRTGGKQNISIGEGCESKGVVMHELFHALGRWHEQSRPDRDMFVTVHKENIKSGVLCKISHTHLRYSHIGP